MYADNIFLVLRKKNVESYDETLYVIYNLDDQSIRLKIIFKEIKNRMNLYNDNE